MKGIIMTKKIQLHPSEEKKWAVVIRGEHEDWEGKYLFMLGDDSRQAIFDLKADAIDFRQQNRIGVDTQIIRVSIKKL